MSDAPKTIGLIQDDFLDGIWAIAHKSEAKRATFYRRADLPPTDEECLRNEKVRALVGLLKDARSDLASYIDHDYPEVTRAQYPDTYRRWKRDMELCWKIDAALAAMQEVKE